MTAVPAPYKSPSWKARGQGESMSDFESQDLNSGDESDEECEGDKISDLDNEDFGTKLAEMAVWGDPTDTDWIPPQLMRRPATSKGWSNIIFYQVWTSYLVIFWE